MMLHLAATVLCLVPRSGPIRDDVDRVEVNNYYGQSEETAFTQLIFWERRNGVWMVQDWRMLDRPGMYPRKNPRTGEYSMLWDDKGNMRSVKAQHLIETWTEHDPEMESRQVLPQEQRRKLSPGKTNWSWND